MTSARGLMHLQVERYVDQVGLWPASGRHILAQWDAESIIVYQAYRPSVSSYAVEHGQFGGEFSYARMSWIKTNFLWMMYRSDWGTKSGQEVTLALTLRRTFFDALLAKAVPSTYASAQYATEDDWHKAVRNSCVRLQWDPDRNPSGAPLKRRALQLGLRGEALDDFGKKEILEILDISDFVVEQRANTSRLHRQELRMPLERVYMPDDPAVGLKLGLER